MKTKELIERLKKIDQNLDWSINLDNYNVYDNEPEIIHKYRVQLNSDWSDDTKIYDKLTKEYSENEKKTLRAHNYFVGVVCPCVCHAYFEAGHISKATFKSLTTEDCIEITKSIFFKKQKIGQNTWTHYSVKVSEWDSGEWNLKVQSIIDALVDRFDYIVPNSNTKHEKNFLERLQK